MHKEGFTFLMHWGGGVSLAKVRDEQDNIIKTEKVSKSVQSYHHVSPVTLAHYLSTPTTNYFDKRNWSKMTESARISAHKAKLDFTASELDPTYFENQEKRFNDYKSQLTLW